MSFLIDRLETLLSGGRRFPFGRVLLDEQELMEIIDQMQLSLPNEINQARRIIQEREQIISQAQAEADKIVTMARDKVTFMLSDNGLILEAKAHSERLLSEARTEAQNLKEEADAYSAEVLTHLEHNLDTTLAQVRRGLERLR
jgi:hypothetical protein